MTNIKKEIRELFSTTYLLDTKPKREFVVQASEDGIWYVYRTGRTIKTVGYRNNRQEAEALAKGIIAGTMAEEPSTTCEA